MANNPWPTKAQVEAAKAQGTGPGKLQSGSLRLESEVDVSRGLSSVFPQSKELEELQQRLERKNRRASETHIDPATGEIREYTRNPATGEGEWIHHGVMSPPESPPESGSAAVGSVNWEEIDRQTRAKYGLPAKQPLGDIPCGGSSPGRPASSGTPYLPGMEPEPTPPPPPPGAAPGGPMPGAPPVSAPSPPEPAAPPEENTTPIPTPVNPGAAHAFRDLGSAVGYAVGGFGGPLGSSIGMAAGGMFGTLLGGGEVKGADVAKTALGLAGGAIAGGVGSRIGSALGGLFGIAEEQAGGGGGGGGATVVAGGGTDGEGGEVVRLLREISINTRTLLDDGLYIRGDHRRASGSQM